MRRFRWELVLVSAALHVGLVLVLPSVSPARASQAPASIDVTLEAAAPAPEPEPPPEPPTAPKVDESPPPEQARTPAPRAAAQPAAAPAQAATVLDAPDAAADFTMPSGEAPRFQGGVTTSRGGQTNAPGGNGVDPTATRPASAPAPRTDASRPPRAVAAAWSCSHLFPTEADAAGAHNAVVRIVVSVSLRGTPERVTVLSDPGLGFGAAAKRCALSQRFLPALDAEGRPTAGTTSPFSVRFTR
jgi:protein TonB